MSRFHYLLNEHIIVVTGNDHALGRFIDLIDLRFKGTPEDWAGEGYIYIYSQMFGTSLNLADLKLDDVNLWPKKKPELIEAINKYIDSIEK